MMQKCLYKKVQTRTILIMICSFCIDYLAVPTWNAVIGGIWFTLSISRVVTIHARTYAAVIPAVMGIRLKRIEQTLVCEKKSNGVQMQIVLLV